MSDEKLIDPHLSFASFDQIIEELGKRAQFVLLAMVVRGKNGGDDNNVKFRTVGGACGALGLCRMVERALLDEFSNGALIHDDE